MTNFDKIKQKLTVDEFFMLIKDNKQDIEHFIPEKYQQHIVEWLEKEVEDV